MGAKPGNLNRATNGSKLRRLTLGELPKELTSVKIEGRQYRRAMEDIILENKGDISVEDAHLLDTACAAVIHGGVCRWLLRQKIGAMTHSDILTCSRELLQSKERRDKAVKALRVDRRAKTADFIEALYEPDGGDDDEREEDSSTG